MPGNSSPAAWSRASTTRPSSPCEKLTDSGPSASLKSPSTMPSAICRSPTPPTDSTDEPSFYDTAEEGERAEKAIADLAANLKKTATEIGVHDQMHAIGITLMQQIYEHFKNHPPPFPMYAYTSKGPFLLEQREWDRISEYGGKVLLKGRVTSDRERTEIIGDIELHRNENSPAAKMQSNVDWLFWTLVQGVFFIAL